jgi:ubiquinone/menaquinone biosynthesis C-methylase UbiE
VRSNRVISRESAAALDLVSRIQLERELTDAEQDLRIPPPETYKDWDFHAYASRSPWRRYMFSFLGSLSGRTIIDLGCGYNPTAVLFAVAGAKTVYAVDVSPRAVNYIQQLADKAGVGDRVVPVVAPAEAIPLPHESVDLVHAEATLHHLDLTLAGRELVRVLRAGGRAAFKDPLGQNRILEFIRDYLPYGWKKPAKGTDHPLTFEAIEKFGRCFRSFTYRGFGLLSMPVALVLGRNNSRPYRLAHEADQALLARCPFLQRWCRFVVTCAIR